MHPEREARQNFIVIGLFVGLAILTGLGIFGVVGLTLVWRVAAVISACVSLLLLILFWHPWLPVGVLINLGILVAILLANWPPVAMFGS